MLGTAIGIQANQRLQERCGELGRECDESDLPEIEAVGSFENGIDRRDQRLEDVVEEVGEADRSEDAKRHTTRLSGNRKCGDGAHSAFSISNDMIMARGGQRIFGGRAIVGDCVS